MRTPKALLVQISLMSLIQRKIFAFVYIVKRSPDFVFRKSFLIALVADDRLSNRLGITDRTHRYILLSNVMVTYSLKVFEGCFFQTN